MFSKNPKVADKKPNSEVPEEVGTRPNHQWKRKWSPLFATAPVVVADSNSDVLATNNRSIKRRHK